MPNDNSKKAVTLRDVRDIVEGAFGPELWKALKAALDVICSLSLKERTNPVALILEGPSGRGKSTVINICEPCLDATRKVLYRLDSFTPKSFVSHSASTPRDKMAEVDLLPKLKDKVLLTKELAPLFRGGDNDLRTNFATLTAVLDGKGHMSASGVHGTRGYNTRLVFNWLGGTTPVPPRTDAIMGQMGNRLLRYEIFGPEVSEEELLEFALNSEAAKTEDFCREIVNDFLDGHFRRYPVNSIDPSTIRFSKELMLHLVRLSRLLAQARVEITRPENTQPGEDIFIASSPEGPHRIVRIFKILVQGLALMEGRSGVSENDLEIIQHVALSSIPSHRRRVLRAVIEKHGELNSAQAEKLLNVSRPTSRTWMRELAATGIVQWTDSDGNSPAKIILDQKCSWLLPADQPGTAQSLGDSEDPHEGGCLPQDDIGLPS
jgi:hypothetical protein